MGTEHVHEFVGSHVRETLQNAFGFCYRVQGLWSTADNQDLTELDNVLAFLETLAFLAGVQDIVGP